MFPRFPPIFYTSIFCCSLFVFALHLLTSTDSPIKSRLSALQCEDVELKKGVEYRGEYIVLKNLVKAERSFKCMESVTLSVPGDYRFLDNVVPLVERWQGPISVALYAPGYDFYSTLQSIAYLRSCHKTSGLVKEFVTFHVFFDAGHMPEMHDRPLLDIYQDKFNCIQTPPYELLKDEEMYKQRTELFYPINVARNVAKLNSQTHFIFPSDIELYPTKNFIPKFMDFVQRRPEYFADNSTNVFVLPVFEIKKNQEIPENKTKLQEMMDKGKALWFHEHVCKSCHMIPKAKEWLNESETNELDIFTSAKRHKAQIIWEPFFVCTQKEPLWDERLNWEGQGNKMCQAFFLCILDYNFLVFDNAFLIHKPGVKKKKIQNIKYKSEQTKNNAILRHIQLELKNIYGNNTKCLVHAI